MRGEIPEWILRLKSFQCKHLSVAPDCRAESLGTGTLTHLQSAAATVARCLNFVRPSVRPSNRTDARTRLSVHWRPKLHIVRPFTIHDEQG